MKLLKSHKCFGGRTEFFEHDSSVLGSSMKFSTFVPAETTPIKGGLIWLSGLTCTDENFMTKAGAQQLLAKLGLVLICPDTSPRGLDLPGEHDSYDFGSGAGFYVDATTEGYKNHYKMASYVNDEIYDYFKDRFALGRNIGILGHSMGGHGALTLGLKNPDKYCSISAFSPIVNPSEAAWGQKAFKGYLGEDRASWARFDATCLVEAGARHPAEILIEQGLADEFYPAQLLSENFQKSCQKTGQKLKLRLQPGYDHSYYFIATFIADHVQHHFAQMRL